MDQMRGEQFKSKFGGKRFDEMMLVQAKEDRTKQSKYIIRLKNSLFGGMFNHRVQAQGARRQHLLPMIIIAELSD